MLSDLILVILAYLLGTVSLWPHFGPSQGRGRFAWTGQRQYRSDECRPNHG